MPTHFHFLVRCKLPTSILKPSEGLEPSEGSNTSEGYSPDSYSLTISRKVGTLLNSYSQAFNKMWNRHGNLFNQKTHAKEITDEDHFIALAFYIHLNPLRSNLVEQAEDWEFSSYKDYIDMRKGSLPNKELILSKYKATEIKEITRDLKPSEG
jgi:hypothetical protein